MCLPGLVLQQGGSDGILPGTDKSVSSLVGCLADLHGLARGAHKNLKQHPDGAPSRSVAFPIRWRIFSFLFGFGFLAYIQQKTITVAAEPMMPALGLSQLQISYIEQAFVLGYAIFQLPGGIIGQRLGARLTFVVIGITAFLATLAMPLVPEFFQGPAALFAALFAVQLLLGVSQGAIFPISAGCSKRGFPPSAGPSCRACRRRGWASARHSRRRSSCIS